MFSAFAGAFERFWRQMATEEYFEDANDPLSGEGKNSLEKLENSPSSVVGSDDDPSTGFDCNICLDSVQDPVVTLCGHLYCWPCIYKWLCFQNISTENLDQKHQQCPVCRAEVSHATLIPLYGRGLTTKASTGNTPKRPLGPSCGLGRIRSLNTTDGLQFRQPFDRPQIYYPQQGGYPYLYTYPNSYNVTGSASRGMRRQLMQADKSLSRISFFLCYCILFCLLLF